MSLVSRAAIVRSVVVALAVVGLAAASVAWACPIVYQRPESFKVKPGGNGSVCRGYAYANTTSQKQPNGNYFVRNGAYMSCPAAIQIVSCDLQLRNPISGTSLDFVQGNGSGSSTCTIPENYWKGPDAPVVSKPGTQQKTSSVRT
jgi:hypothetical protein